MLTTDVKVDITDRAVEQIKKLMILENKAGAGLKIGVKSGGCSGLSYFMEFQDAPLANDQVLEFENGEVKLYVDVFSAMYLNDCELDFTDGLNGSGFVWSNPNAQRSCGCGQSFSA